MIGDAGLRLRNEASMLRYSLKMLVGRSMLAAAMVAAGLVVAVVTYPVGSFQTRLSALLLQMEMFSPLLGVTIFSGLIAADFESRRADLLRVSAVGPAAVAFRRLLHAALFTAVACAIVLAVLRVVYTPFDLVQTWGIVVPGALYYGLIGLVAATAARNALVGYAAGTAAVIVSLSVDEIEPLSLASFHSRARLVNERFLAEGNWLIAKVYFVIMAVVLGAVVLRLIRNPGARIRPVLGAVALIVGSYAGMHWVWTRPAPERPAFAGPGQVLDVREKDGTLAVRTAVTHLFWHRGERREKTLLQEIRYQRKEGQWVRQGEAPFDSTAELDLLHVEIQAAVTPATQELHATAAMKVKVVAGPLYRAFLRLGWELQIESLKVGGEAVEFKKRGDLVEVPLARAAQAGDVLEVEIKYAGRLQLPYRDPTECATGDLLMAMSRWFPETKGAEAGAADPFTCRVSVQVPKGYRVAAAAVVGEDGGRTTCEWDSRVPVTLVPLCVGRFREYESRYGEIPVSVCTFTLSEAQAKRMLERAVAVLGVHEKAFGRYPYGRLAIVENPYQNAGGHGLPSMVTIKPERMAAEHEARLLDGYLPHEIAHLWWDNTLPGWVREGAAVYANYRFVAETQGRKAAGEFLDREIYVPYLKSEGQSVPLAKDRGASMYAKAGYLLVGLESQSGGTLVDALRGYYQRHESDSIVDPEMLERDFVQAIQQASGEEMRRGIADWVEGGGRFDPAISGFSQNRTEQGNEVVLRLEHMGQMRFPAPVRLVLADGSKQDLTWNTRETREELRVRTAAAVVSAEIDPDHVLLDANRRNNRPMPSMPGRAQAAQAQTGVAGWKLYGPADRVSGLDARCLLVGRDQRVHVGFWAMDLAGRREWAVDSFDGTWRRLAAKAEAVPLVTCMAEGADGAMWLGGPAGLWRIKGAQVTHWTPKDVRVGGRLGDGVFQPNPTANSSIPGSRIHAVLVDAQGGVWVGTDRGVSFLAAGGENWRHLSKAEGLCGAEVLCLAQDQAGVVWAGTEGGVARWTGERWAAQAGSPSDVVLALAADGQGMLWVGTYRSGLLSLGKDGTWRRITSSNSGLPHDMVCALACDSEGRVWAGTSDGLACLGGNSWRIYTQGDSGLPSDRIQCLATDGSGRVWIGTSAGLASYIAR